MISKPLKAGLAVGAITVALLLIRRTQAPSTPPPTPLDSTLALNALAEAHQPATASARVKQAGLQGDRCHYAEAAAGAALDADLAKMAEELLDAAPQDCSHKLLLLGERAEALARIGLGDEATDAAKQALSTHVANAYAELALARVAFDANQMKVCTEHAERALKAGRGAEAERLLGRSALARGLFKEAALHFQSVLQTNPNDVEAAFSLGVCADKLGNYHQAREAFLQTLRIDPQHVEARKYLVVMTYHAGAKDEARHHLDKLEQVASKDSTIAQGLEALLSGKGADADVPPASAPEKAGTR